MANRTVFAIFGSVGPAGAFVSIAEKICTAIFPKAYNYGDPEQFESDIDKDLKKCRELYILELFKYKNEFSRSQTKGTDEKQKAYERLVQIIKRFVEKMTRLEKNKYMRERIYYQRTNQHVMYEEANKNYTGCGKQVNDNLVKQAKTICNPSQEDFDRYFSEFNIDTADHKDDDNEIWERIPQATAFKYFDTYQDLQKRCKDDEKNVEQWKGRDDLTDEQKALVEIFSHPDFGDGEQYVKDKLFIEAGEDVEDIFIAFKYYKCDQTS